MTVSQFSAVYNITGDKAEVFVGISECHSIMLVIYWLRVACLRVPSGLHQIPEYMQLRLQYQNIAADTY